MATLEQFSDLPGTNGRKLRLPTLPVRVRSIRPADAPALQAGFQELSDMSRYHRFHSGMTRLPERLLRYLTEVDGIDHVALVALEADDSGDEHGVGVARFVRNRQDPATAELAVTVLDRAQGRGVARRLLAELASAAQVRGIESFTANVIAGNSRARRLLTSLGAIGRGHAADVMAFHLPVAALTQPAH
jgi:GNAT superfamily N-acetyltransferase